MSKLNRFNVLAPMLMALTISCGQGRSADERLRGREVYNTCASCHGVDGSGNQALGAPAIAGLDAWYVGGQLRKFKDGTRGAHPSDAEGGRMAAAARGLRSERDIVAVATHVRQLPPSPGRAVVEGDLGRGRRLWGQCAGCHGPLASGNRTNGAPPLSRTDDGYLLAQLGKFRTGVRGTHPDDASGAIMRSVALELPDDQAMSDVVAYVASLR